MNFDLNTDEGRTNAADWTRAQMALLKVGGVWSIPRSGCFVIKTGERSCCVTSAACEPGVVAALAGAGYDVVSDIAVILPGTAR